MYRSRLGARSRFEGRCGGGLDGAMHLEFRDIGSRRQIDADFGFVPMFVIILRDSLADLTRRGAHYRIEIRVVIRFAREDRYPQGAFLQLLRATLQRAFHHKAQEVRITLAVFEQGIRQHPLQLLADSLPFLFSEAGAPVFVNVRRFHLRTPIAAILFGAIISSLFRRSLGVEPGGPKKENREIISDADDFARKGTLDGCNK